MAAVLGSSGKHQKPGGPHWGCATASGEALHCSNVQRHRLDESWGFPWTDRLQVWTPVEGLCYCVSFHVVISCWVGSYSLLNFYTYSWTCACTFETECTCHVHPLVVVHAPSSCGRGLEGDGRSILEVARRRRWRHAKSWEIVLSDFRWNMYRNNDS